MSSIFPIAVNYANLRDVSLGRYAGIISFLLAASISLARAFQSVTLAWIASPGSDVAGYKIYYGTTSGSPTQSLDVGNVTIATVSNVNEATTYFFSVVAYDSAGLQSQPSNEVSYTTPSGGYSLTVSNGSGDGNYAAGTQVLVRADPPPQGQLFLRWDGDYAILTNFLEPTTTATIPLRDVAITAAYATSPTFVESGTGAGEGTGLLAQYYNDSPSAAYPLANPFTGSPVLTRTDARVDFNWGGNSPASPVRADNFSVKWTGQVKAPVSGSYTFTVFADDGVRLLLNGAKVIDGWKDESARVYSYTTTLTAGTLYDIELHYYEHNASAVCRLQWSYPGQSTQAIPQSQLYPSLADSPGTGLRGQYYNDSNSAGYPLVNPFAGTPVLTRIDATVDFTWGGNSPGSPVSAENFSVKWTGQVKAPVSGTYAFTVIGDDGVRLFLNGTKVIDGWKDQSPISYSYTTTLTAGTLYDIELHYYEHNANAVCWLQWSYPGQSTQAIPQSQLYPSEGQN
jgi:hypothetical protein